ncbi:hypothetical protein ACS3SW_20700 [Roseobacteraceae bacterium S113]
MKKPRPEQTLHNDEPHGDIHGYIVDPKEEKSIIGYVNVAVDEANLAPYWLTQKTQDGRISEELTDFENELLKVVRDSSLSEDEKTRIVSALRNAIEDIDRSRFAQLLPTEAPVLWRNRDKSLDQEPHQFIQATYFDAGHSIDRKTLRKLDRSLLTQLEAQERDPERRPPQEFLERFPRKKDQLDAEVSRIKETGERPHSWREQHRLRQAAKRRGTDLNQS